MPVTDKPNVLEGLSFVIPNGGKGALCSHISQHMVKSQSELEKSHSWRFEPQRSETFSRVADLRIPKVKSFLMNNSFPPLLFSALPYGLHAHCCIHLKGSNVFLGCKYEHNISIRSISF